MQTDLGLKNYAFKHKAEIQSGKKSSELNPLFAKFYNLIHPHPGPWSPSAPPKAGKPLPSRERQF
jgi:hypothetical protein